MSNERTTRNLTISSIIAYAMIPNDLSAFVGLLRHCPCQSLKRNDVENELTWGMELEEIALFA